MDEVKDLGDRIRKRRTERGISQVALARAIGVSTTAIFKLESGHTRMLRADHLLRIAIELGADPYILVFGEHSAEFRHFGFSHSGAEAALLSSLPPAERRLLAKIIDLFLEDIQPPDTQRAHRRRKPG